MRKNSIEFFHIPFSGCYIIKNFIYAKKSTIPRTLITSWATRIRTLKMTESESVALPFGDSPMSFRLVYDTLIFFIRQVFFVFFFLIILS